MTIDKTERELLVHSLRELANYLEQHHRIPLPALDVVNAFVYTKDEFRDAVRALGTVRKTAAQEWFWVTKQFGGIEYQLNIARERVCERVVVGTHVEPERVVEDVEWRCAESVLEGE